MSAAAGVIEPWRRHALLGVSVLSIVGGLLVLQQGAADHQFAAAIALRVGMVLFIGWLALPQLERLNYWVLLPIIGLGAVLCLRPQLIPPLVQIGIRLAPILFLLWLFRRRK